MSAIKFRIAHIQGDLGLIGGLDLRGGVGLEPSGPD